MSGPVTHRGRLAFEAGRSGEGWPPALDGPAVGRLIRALEAGVRGPDLGRKGGRMRGETLMEREDEAAVEGLPAQDAYLLGQVVRYVDRAGRKDETAIDLGKANNYAHRLVRGKWRDR